MPLTDTAIRLAKPTGRDYTLKDGDGRALFVGASGAKNWHFRFSWVGKQPLDLPYVDGFGQAKLKFRFLGALKGQKTIQWSLNTGLADDKPEPGCAGSMR